MEARTASSLGLAFTHPFGAEKISRQATDHAGHVHINEDDEIELKTRRCAIEAIATMVDVKIIAVG